ncbi:MAG TPA: hypothetical protein VHR66_14445 [Gemmataceae bacterium]|jgi:hypothetical protein|nr:hypothetical protein [Gemmataceae bacterium]
MISPSTYRPYKNLPPLAGLATHEEAAKPGLGIEECVTRLKRFHYAFKRLFEILTARITAEPIYELKTAFAYHAYLCAEHADALRTRIGEMREPPLGLEAVPHPALEVFFDEILAAPTTEDLIWGIYQMALHYLITDIEAYQGATNPLTDAPSRRVLKFALFELNEMREFGRKVREEFRAPSEGSVWINVLEALIEEAGGISGTWTASDNGTPRMYSKTPHKYDPIPKRDERWQDLWNQGVNPEAFMYDPAQPTKPKALMMLFKRLREIDVPEMMASILTETKGKPWRFYRDMSRQLWDEARHAMMGEVGFVALGVDWTKARVTHNWSLRLNTECTPMERHAVLYFIEQGLMTKTGKRFEWELGVGSGIPLMATIQDFDWADEVLHAAIGRQWYIPLFENINKALEYGDQCWSRILSNWQVVKDQGLTQHENWWPAIYRQACEAWGEAPDPQVLAYSTTYEGKRADLKEVGAGASG